MEIFLTEEELAREESLFAPKSARYEKLEGKPYDIKTYKDEAGDDENMPRPPSSC